MTDMQPWSAKIQGLSGFFGLLAYQTLSAIGIGMLGFFLVGQRMDENNPHSPLRQKMQMVCILGCSGVLSTFFLIKALPAFLKSREHSDSAVRLFKNDNVSSLWWIFWVGGFSNFFFSIITSAINHGIEKRHPTIMDFLPLLNVFFGLFALSLLSPFVIVGYQFYTRCCQKEEQRNLAAPPAAVSIPIPMEVTAQSGARI